MSSDGSGAATGAGSSKSVNPRINVGPTNVKLAGLIFPATRGFPLRRHAAVAITPRGDVAVCADGRGKAPAALRVIVRHGVPLHKGEHVIAG
jgi:hypothetical protein